MTVLSEVLVRLSRSALEPHTQRQRSLLAMYQAGEDAMTTEIAARLFINDFPDHPLGWQILGALLHDHGRLEEALSVKQETVKRFPKDANAHNNLACTLLALQRYPQALESARTALLLDSKLAQARRFEALAFTAMRDAA